MALTISISLGWIVFLAIGWINVLICIVFLIFLVKLTPAMTFLKASMARKAVVFLKGRSGMGKFVLGRPTTYGTVNIKGHGPLMQTADSRVLEVKSKAAIYTAFTEFGATLPQDYEPIISEMKKGGFKINNFLDYNHYYMLASNQKYAEEYVGAFKKDDKKKEAEALIKKCKEFKINIYPVKSYNVHELGSMFPYNMNPVFIEGAIVEETTKRMNSARTSNQTMITAAIAIMLILVGIGFGYKMLTSGDDVPVEVIVRTVQTGVEAVKMNASLMM